jgi:hypothetical protein
MKKRNSDRRKAPRIQCRNKLTITSHDGYHIVASAYDLSSLSAQIRCDLRAAFVLNPSGNQLKMARAEQPVRISLLLPVHGELVEIHAECGITGFRQLSQNEVAVTLRFIEFRDQCDDQLRYFIDTSLANEIFGDGKVTAEPRAVALNPLSLLLPTYLSNGH